MVKVLTVATGMAEEFAMSLRSSTAIRLLGVGRRRGNCEKFEDKINI